MPYIKYPYIWICLWDLYSVLLIYFSVLASLSSEKAMATHSSTLAWKIPWTEEPGRLQSMGSRRVGHDWETSLHVSLSCLEEEMAIHSSVLAWRIPATAGPCGLPSMGSHRVRRNWSDLEAAAVAPLSHLLQTITVLWVLPSFSSKLPWLFLTLYIHTSLKSACDIPWETLLRIWLE